MYIPSKEFTTEQGYFLITQKTLVLGGVHQCFFKGDFFSLKTFKRVKKHEKKKPNSLTSTKIAGQKKKKSVSSQKLLEQNNNHNHNNNN